MSGTLLCKFLRKSRVNVRILWKVLNVSRNILLNFIGRPSLYIPSCMIIWGTISILTGEHIFIINDICSLMYFLQVYAKSKYR